jgi:hypothetical protein
MPEDMPGMATDSDMYWLHLASTALIEERSKKVSSGVGFSEVYLILEAFDYFTWQIGPTTWQT